MSDTPNKPEPQTEPTAKVTDLPEKPINEQDAQAVKGGAVKRVK
jgi:hypothetical protein